MYKKNPKLTHETLGKLDSFSRRKSAEANPTMTIILKFPEKNFRLHIIICYSGKINYTNSEWRVNKFQGNRKY